MHGIAYIETFIGRQRHQVNYATTAQTDTVLMNLSHLLRDMVWEIGNC
jgi:hypothetical protein